MALSRPALCLGIGLVVFAPAIGWAVDPELGPSEPFSFDLLQLEAQEAAGRPFEPRPIEHADTLEDVDFDAHWQITFKTESSVWMADNSVPIQFFHLGRYFKEPVAIHLVEGEEAREILYTPDFFDIPDDNPAKSLPNDVGFAGFRVMNNHLRNDWMSFLGASYFRTDGALGQYGLSARAVAVDPAMPQAEEFPRFSAFWLAPPEQAEDDLVIMARLESPSLEGAFKFGVAHDDGTVMTIEGHLYPRAPIERLGLAPLTSMFWYAESNRATAPDWRPEIHDSDGLSIWTGGGEKLWRPLNNPDRVVVSSFFDENIEGYGLLQRDRSFNNYQDDSVFYDRRPSVWVEPLGDWGRGA
ncbi:MAG: glucan biosynthesis protein, partial [Pseudomonadota bacterium]